MIKTTGDIKIEKLLKLWRMRLLAIDGRILILNFSYIKSYTSCFREGCTIQYNFSIRENTKAILYFILT